MTGYVLFNKETREYYKGKSQWSKNPKFWTNVGHIKNSLSQSYNRKRDYFNDLVCLSYREIFPQIELQDLQGTNLNPSWLDNKALWVRK